MKAVILAAGEGQRLPPLTLTRPKHMLSVGGKPLLEHLLLALAEVGIKDILIVVHYKAEKIEEGFGDGSKLGIAINYAFQEEVGGTADAFGLAESYMKEDFLAVYGDLLLTPNALREVIEFHNRRKPAATLTALHIEHPEYYGILKTKGNEVIEIIEKPSPEVAAGNLVNAGLYVFSTAIFDGVNRTKPSPRGEREVTDSIQMLIKEKKAVLMAEIPRQEWMDVGKPWDLLQANERILKHTKQEHLGTVEDGANLHGTVFVSRGAMVRSGAYIEGPVFIGENSDIGPNCYVRPCTSIGRNVRVGNACEVKNSIIMDDVHIGHLSYVGDSVIGEACNLGAGFISANVRFDDETVRAHVKGEVVNSDRRKMGVFMGDGVKTGVGAVFMPGICIGCNSWIGPNIVVNKDVPSDVILMLKQQIDETSH